ncbi:acyl-CoA dehydrogenase family protein [Stappia sp.]|uniref:acyl-CoA dehydrogenase family protein n=1 Tax=Stappia sp. TaxID=1870903 RepID=UPI0032D946FA
MDFSFTPEQDAFKEKVLEFARTELDAGDLRERDETCTLSRDLWKKIAGFGILGLPFDRAYGGQEQDIITTVLAMEALGYGCRDNGLLFSMNGQMWTVQMPIAQFGTPEQKEKYLTGLIAGDLIGAHGITEAEAGSDVMSLGTSAVRDGDHYVLNGAKVFCTNGPVADVFVIFATVDKSAGSLGLTGFVVDRDTPGLIISENRKKMGLRTSPMAWLTLEDCRVPVSARIGKEGQGGRIFNNSMEWERSSILANLVGAMERQLEDCIEHANKRTQFRKPIGKFQSVSNRIVDMKLRHETSKLLLYKVAWLKKTKGSCPMEAALAKLYLSEAWVSSCQNSVVLHGGYGYMQDREVERDFRDAVGGLLYSGTSDIQRTIAARALGL